MTAKRFIIPEGYRVIKNTVTDECAIFYDTEDGLMFLKWLNELADENEQLKQQKDKWKQQCIHFKEMLDDMAIAYLCDEWIYEEMKGDVE